MATTFLIIGALFVIRIAVLAILIIFSPVGFVAGIFPGTKKFADEWWGALFSQSFFAPIMALMLVVALNVMKAMNSGDVLKRSVEQTMGGGQPAGADYSTIIVGGATMAIPLIILWVGLASAKKFGAVGADVTQKYISGMMNWVGKHATLTPAAFLGRKYEKLMTDDSKNKYARYTKWAAPSVIKKAFEDWRKESHETDKAPVERAAGGAQDTFNAIFGKRTNNAFAVRRRQENKKTKELLEISKNADYLINELDHAYEEGEADMVAGALEALAQTNNLNDLMAASGGKSYGKGLDPVKYKNKKGEEKEAVMISSKNYGTMMNNMLADLGFKPGSKEMAMERMALGETALAAGNGALFGQVAFVDGDWRTRSLPL